LDTRDKIKRLEDLRPLLAENSWTALVGAFDPLMAESVALIERAHTPGHKLLIVVRSEPNELLSAQARAVLLAGVRFVDAVHVAETDDWRSVIESVFIPITEEEGDCRRREEFEALVEARHGASPGA
jgi:phosphopantetheine adenylyltransferase